MSVDKIWDMTIMFRCLFVNIRGDGCDWCYLDLLLWLKMMETIIKIVRNKIDNLLK